MANPKAHRCVWAGCELPQARTWDWVTGLLRYALFCRKHLHE